MIHHVIHATADYTDSKIGSVFVAPYAGSPHIARLETDRADAPNTGDKGKES